ncbi:MAG: TetR/AcrR family transcriptional regulator [Hyphomicrobiaceae bacterium]
MPRPPSSRALDAPGTATLEASTSATDVTPSARERILRAATDLFCRYGINATGIDAIIERSGTAKATLYKAFGSKDALIEAVLATEGETWRQWFIGEIEALPGGPREKLIGCFDVLRAWFADEQYFGCPFINAVGEFDKSNPRFKAIALGHKAVVMAYIGDLTRATGAVAPDQLAHQIGLLIDGAIVAAMITGDPRMADYAQAAARDLLADR